MTAREPLDSRATILRRVHTALQGTNGPPSPVPREYRRTGELGPGTEGAIALLVDRLVDYKAVVQRTTATGLADAINKALGAADSVVIPAGLELAAAAACRSASRTVTVDGEPDVLTPANLDRIAAVVTNARVAIALSGTIILDGAPDQGRRVITLVPDLHVIVLHENQVVQTVPEALALVEPTRPLTMIAGPSATSDIELQRVEGVHGPRTLQVILVQGPDYPGTTENNTS